METKKIKIELLSDMCVSDGGIYNSAIDTDVCYDSYGLPYIPGKRLKGCLRECAQELNDWGDEIPISEMFGEKGNQKGKVIICNAYMEDAENYIRSIQKFPKNPLCHPQNVLNQFSYIRTQTSINYDTGIAEEKSLRTTRVVNKGLKFEADLEIEDKYCEALERCLTVFRHIGIARTRGYGEIRASLMSEEIEQNSKDIDNINEDKFNNQDNMVLKYEIYLREPIICKSVNGQEENSLDYIEGIKILGLIIQMFKDDSKEDKFLECLNKEGIYFSNAYLSANGKRLYEVPASIFEIKNNDKDYRNKIYIENELAKEKTDKQTPTCDNDLQLNQMKHKYVYINKNGNMECHSVEMEMRYHHSRPKDKSVGRAAELIDSDSKFYQISSIQKGQTFEGIIQAPANIIKEIYEYLKNNAVVSLGYGKNGEYGRCDIHVIDINKQIAQQEKEIEKFYVLLKSPTIIYNSKAMYSTNVKDLIEEVFANVFTDDSWNQFDIDITKYVNITSIGGFNVTWQQRKPTIYGFDKGTVICVNLNRKAKVKLGQFWIGERCIEGFGEVEVLEITDTRNYQGKILDSYLSGNKEQISADISKEPLLYDIASRLFKEFLRYKASVEAKSFTISDAFKPTVSNMLLMCKEESTVDDVYSNCQDRFFKSSDNKNKKLAVANEILECVKPKDSDRKDIIDEFYKEFQDIYQIDGFICNEKKDDWKKEYLHELLIQLKYSIRKGEKASVKKEGYNE